MNLQKNLKSIMSTCLLGASVVLVGCGGAPDASGSDSGGDESNLVPTNLSLSGDLNKFGTLDSDGVTVEVQAILTDNSGNFDFDGREITFVSPEYGAVESRCTIETIACTVTWFSSGSPRVISENPLEFDRVVNVMGTVLGAEPFADANGNGLYDDGETVLDDYPEPFVDEDNDLNYTAGEEFVDVNNNGVWDAADGQWNGPCSLKAGSCDGLTPATLFSWHSIYLCPREPDGDPNCQEEGVFPAP